jgi:hypothetical protein
MLPFAKFRRDAYFEHAQRFSSFQEGLMAPSNGTVGQTATGRRGKTGARRNQGSRSGAATGVGANPTVGAIPNLSYDRLCGIVEGFALAHNQTPAQTMSGLNKHRTW